jgi:competence protein ComGC
MMVDTDFAQWEKEKEAHTMFELLWLSVVLLVTTPNVPKQIDL